MDAKDFGTALQLVNAGLQIDANNSQLKAQQAAIELIPKGMANQINITDANQQAKNLTGSSRTDSLPNPAASQPGVGLGAINPMSAPNMQAMAAPQFAQSSKGGSLHQAYSLLAVKDYSHAEIFLTEWIDRNPSDAVAYMLRAKTNLELGHYNNAVADAQEVLRTYPRDIETLNNESLALTHLGRAKEALQVSQEALRYNPMNADSHFVRSKAEHALGMTKEEMEDLRDAARFDPQRYQGFVPGAGSENQASSPLMRNISNHPWSWLLAVLFLLAGLAIIVLLGISFRRTHSIRFKAPLPGAAAALCAASPTLLPYRFNSILFPYPLSVKANFSSYSATSTSMRKL